ncbi:hypothetical protein V5F32_17845 [Xanthobacter oligotrophicus]|uniref:Uncharacterized protein n=1 Tax=Xanthobacter oligotrophicus TaxID=2607286 RepID=A0ABW7A1A6_9HYPH
MTTSTDAFAAVTLLFGALPLEAAPIPSSATVGPGAPGLAADAPRPGALGKAPRLLPSRILPRLGGWGR